MLLVTVVYFAKRRRGQNRNQNPYYNPSEGSNPTATTGYSNRPERETTAFIVNSEGKETLDGSVETKVIPHILKNYEKFRKKQGMCFKVLRDLRTAWSTDRLWSDRLWCVDPWLK